MPPGDWPDIEAIFTAAVERPPKDRARLLDERCAGRPDVRAEVESLLAAHDRAGDFLDSPAAGADFDPDLTGRTVGPFRLLAPVGRGGMSVVYRAERASGEFAQQVAVKIIDGPLQSAEVLRRFKAERQILAALTHPHIVTLLDGGVTPDGQAYLAMEYIDGVPITDHAVGRQLSLEERLRLFQRVLSAVQYAHQHGVVHRDLKPANILVTADGMPKVLDFGVAKLLAGPEADRTATLTGFWRPLTPNYASPEQLRGLPVTTACDIYALGVLLYELLTGRRPYETAGRSLDEILRIVAEDDPRRPSAARADEMPGDRRRLRGDLDAIVLKAMSKQPDHRYGSARELSEDLDRHLAGQPVVAREPSFRYVLAKAARRHRAAFAAAAVSTVALLAALGVSLWERHVAVAERNLATERFNDVRQIANALIFKLDAAVQPLPGSTPVRQQIVAEGLAYLERLTRDSSRDDALTLEMARAYHRIADVQGNPSLPNLGDRAGAVTSYQKAIGLLRPLAARPGGSRDAALELGRVELSFSTVVNTMGRRDEALSAVADAARTAGALIRQDATDEQARRLAGSAEFSVALLSSDPESLEHWTRAGQVFRTLLSANPDDPDRQRNVALVEKYIGAYYERQQDYQAALSHHVQAEQLDERRLEAQPSDRRAQYDVAIDLGNVAFAQWQTGHLAEAAAGYEHSLEVRQRLAESDPKDILARSRVAYVHSRLARLYGEMNEGTRSLEHAREAVRLGQTMAGVDIAHDEMLAEDLDALGDAETRAHHRSTACTAYRRSLKLLAGVLARTGLDPSLVQRTIRARDGVVTHVAGCGPS